MLHPQLGVFIQKTRELFPYIDLYVLTNGILLNTLSDEVLNLIKENDVTIQVSVYPNISGYEKSKLKLENYNIKHFYNNVNKFSTCVDVNGTSDNYDICLTKYCHTLRDGIISSCYFPILSHYFNEHFNIDLPTHEDNEIVNVRQSTTYEDACAILLKPCNFCKYCTASNGRQYMNKYINNGSQPELFYWAGVNSI